MARFDRTQYVRVPVEELNVGIVLRSPIYDDDENSPVLLIAAGKQLSPQQMDKIRARGISHVLIGKGDLGNSPKEAKRRQRLREEREEREKELSERTKWSNGQQPFLRVKAKPPSNPKHSKVAEEFGNAFESSIASIGDVFVDLGSGHEVSGEDISMMASECLRQISDDVDLFVSLGMTPDVTRYPVSHSIQVARLAMSMGAVIGMDQESLMQLGTGCLLHDVGMVGLDPDLLNCERPLDRIEMLDIHRHPIKTIEMIEHINGLTTGARMVAYQLHERLDGSGYPRGRNKLSIHPMAKLAMVADMFVAMTSPRPHRPAIWPYFAIVELLEQVDAGRLDGDCVRALLDTVSMFPLGSFVELTDSRRGTVIRAHPGAFTTPIVDVGTAEEDIVVDLREQTEIKVARPLGAL